MMKTTATHSARACSYVQMVCDLIPCVADVAVSTNTVTDASPVIVANVHENKQSLMLPKTSKR